MRGIRYQVEALSMGDYLFYDDRNPDNRVLIERKNIGDLVSSYIDGRLKNQMAKLANEPFPILLVTGTIKDLRGKLPFKPDERLVEKVMAEAVMRYGFRSVIWIVGGFKDPRTEGLLFVVNALKELVSNNLDKIPTKKVKRQGEPLVDTIKIMFDVPINVAEELSRKFGNLRKLIDASAEDLLKVHGVGETRVNRIKQIVDGKLSKADKTICEKCGNKKTPVRYGNKVTLVCVSSHK